LAQTRCERRAYPSGVCKERATTSGPKITAARRVASLFGSGFVAPRSQPHFGGCSLVAPRQNRKSTQQTGRSYETEYLATRQLGQRDGSSYGIDTQAWTCAPTASPTGGSWAFHRETGGLPDGNLRDAPVNLGTGKWCRLSYCYVSETTIQRRQWILGSDEA